MSDTDFNLGGDTPVAADDDEAASYFGGQSFDTPDEAPAFEAADDSSEGGEGIDLDFTGVDSISGYVPVPRGPYVIEFVSAKVSPTKDKTGQNVEVTMKVADHPENPEKLRGRAVGKDFWYVPNKAVQEAKKYETTAGFFKGRLEAIYDRSIDGSFKFNVRDLPTRKCKALVIVEDNGYGPQNNVTAYLPMSTDLSNVVMPEPTASRRGNSNNTGGAPGEAAPGRFTI